MKNKAQMGESFRYIFGIIIGAMFLVFFIGFAWKLIAISDQTTDKDIALAISNDLSAAAVSEDATNTLNYGREISFTISKGLLTPSKLSVGKDMNQIIFSPKEIQGEELYTATKTLSLPYESTNLFYLTDKKTFYVVVYDQGTQEFADELIGDYALFPSNFEGAAYNQQTLTTELDQLKTLTHNYNHVRFIFITDQEINPAGEFSSYSIIEVSSRDEDYEYGTVTFEDGQSIFLSQEMLMGAIVAENKEEYDYNLELMLSSVEDITEMYYEKAKFISTRLPNCEYAQVKTSLNNYKSFIGNTESPESYNSYITTVETANKNLGGDCPEIF
jgi:hypothetical protein